MKQKALTKFKGHVRALPMSWADFTAALNRKPFALFTC